MDALAALRLQIEWGADEALMEMPLDRLAAPPPPRPTPVPAAPARPAPTPALRGPAQASLLPASTPAARAADLAAAATTLDELRAALAGFDGCALRETATRMVFSDGEPASGLMFVGEAPGAEEDRSGLPFVGISGKLFDRMAASIGLDRSRFLITNVIPWRPPGNRTPTDAEVAACLPFLLRHVALAKPRHLVLLGGLAAKAVTGSSAGIRRLRGRWQQVQVPGLDRPVPALPMLHPAYLLRTPAAKREAWADLLLLREAIEGSATS